MHIWMEEKNTEIVSLQAQLQEQQTALLEKKIELALLQEKMAYQEQQIQQEIAMMKLSLMAEINMGSINKGSYSNPSFKSKIQIQSLRVHARSDLIQNERNLGEVSTQKVDEAELELNNSHQENKVNFSTSKSKVPLIGLNSQKEACNCNVIDINSIFRVFTTNSNAMTLEFLTLLLLLTLTNAPY
jgi:hypothetical protein